MNTTETIIIIVTGALIGAVLLLKVAPVAPVALATALLALVCLAAALAAHRGEPTA